MALGERIKDLRKHNKMTQTDLANELNSRFNLNVDRVMISKWETGFQTPVMYNISCIAKIFNVSIDYLNGIQTSKDFNLNSPTITDDIVVFPVIGEVAAGYDHIALEDWSGDTIEIPSRYLRGRKKEDFIVLKVKGDSMYPMYQNGDVVLVLKQDTMNHSGEIGAVIYEDENATLKKIEYVEGEDWMRLVPLNPEYMPKTIEGEALDHCRVIGIPKLLIREF